jgi:hypothetical protein
VLVCALNEPDELGLKGRELVRSFLLWLTKNRLGNRKTQTFPDFGLEVALPTDLDRKRIKF